MNLTEIEGIKVEFPFKPYGIQIEILKKVNLIYKSIITIIIIIMFIIKY